MKEKTKRNKVSKNKGGTWQHQPGYPRERGRGGRVPTGRKTCGDGLSPNKKIIRTSGQLFMRGGGKKEKQPGFPVANWKKGKKGCSTQKGKPTLRKKKMKKKVRRGRG